MMMTKPISKRRNVIYGLLIVPLSIALVSCLGKYDQITLANDSLVWQEGEIVSVDFHNRNSGELEQIKEEMKLFNIDVVVDHIKYDSDGIMNESIIFANFNNGSTAQADFKNNTLVEPYGFWMNLKNGKCGVGCTPRSKIKSAKERLIEEINSLNKIGADIRFRIDNESASYAETISWIKETKNWQSHKDCPDFASDSKLFTFNLYSSPDYNPFQSDWRHNSHNKERVPLTVDEFQKGASKDALIETMNNVNNGQGKFFVNKKEVSFEEAGQWLAEAEFYQSSVSCDGQEVPACTIKLARHDLVNPWNNN